MASWGDLRDGSDSLLGDVQNRIDSRGFIRGLDSFLIYTRFGVLLAGSTALN